MNLPSVLVVGPMKAGTTWLHDFLESSSDVCLPKDVKETFYFDLNQNKGLNWYSSHFKKFNAYSQPFCMEIAPSYFHSEKAPEKIYDQLGDITIIFTLRDPIKRSWSHYLHLRRYGYTNKSLSEAIIDHPQIINASSYGSQIERWRKYFTTDKIHILWQEDLANNPEEYARKFCRILNIDFKGLSADSSKKSNAAAVAPSVLVAGVGRFVSYKLRSYKMYKVVNFAKHLGLKNLFFGKPNPSKLPIMTLEDKELLRSKLSEDFLKFPYSLRHQDINFPDSSIR